MDISEVFDAVAQELRVGRASAEFSPYAELKHTWKVADQKASFKVSDYLQDAPDEVIYSLARYLVPMALCSKRMNIGTERYLAFMRSREFWHSKRDLYLSRAKNLSLVPQGRNRDLRQVFDYVNSTYFRGKIRDPTLAWVQESPARRLGYYFEPLNLLAVNRVFDAERVPRYALEFVVYHELLHHIDAESGRRTRRVHHTRLFKEQEKRFTSYADAEGWLRRLVSEYKVSHRSRSVPRA